MATRAMPEQRRIPAKERRALIVRAAGRAFARDGYAGTRIEDIAAAAHVTKPIVYRHFDSKKALYMALLEQHEADLPSFIEAIDPEGLDARPARAGDPRALVRLRPREPARVVHAVPRPLGRRRDPGAAAAREPAGARGDRRVHQPVRRRARSRPPRSSLRPRPSRTVSPDSRCGGSTIRTSRRTCRSTSARGS